MVSILENENYLVKVHAKGAELQSFIKKDKGYEVIWQRDPKYWERSSPILFPFIGAVKDNHYYLQGKEYPMTRHGFLRDVEFKLVEKRENFLSYHYEHNEKTKEMFPFDFKLMINYLLVEHCLTIEYVLKNLTPKKMYYNIGGHTAYNFPMNEKNCTVIFEKNETKKSGTFDLESGLRLDQGIELLKDDKTLKMSFDLFKYDTLLLKDLASDYVILDQGRKSPKVKIHFSDFPYLALWTPKAPFLCVEPWYGVTDDLGHNGQIEEKRGIQSLNPYGEKILKTIIEII